MQIADRYATQQINELINKCRLFAFFLVILLKAGFVKNDCNEVLKNVTGLGVRTSDVGAAATVDCGARVQTKGQRAPALCSNAACGGTWLKNGLRSNGPSHIAKLGG